MKLNKRKISGSSLIIGMVFFVIGLATNNTVFTWIAIAFLLVSLVLGGRWMRPRKR